MVKGYEDRKHEKVKVSEEQYPGHRVKPGSISSHSKDSVEYHSNEDKKHEKVKISEEQHPGHRVKPGSVCSYSKDSDEYHNNDKEDENVKSVESSDRHNSGHRVKPETSIDETHLPGQRKYTEAWELCGSSWSSKFSLIISSKLIHN